MTPRLSRRSFLIGLGGGAASAALAWAVWQHDGWRQAGAGYPVPDCCNFVDYGGWMLTRVDKERLLDAGSVRRMDNTVFEDGDIASQLVPGLDECESWCLGDPSCQAFSYAKPSHPDPSLRDRCWLKGTSQVTPVANPGYTSGVR